MYPFFKAGRILFFTEKDLLPEISLLQFVNADGKNTFFHLCESVLGGIAAWGTFSVLTGFLFYRIILQYSKIFVRDTDEPIQTNLSAK